MNAIDDRPDWMRALFPEQVTEAERLEGIARMDAERKAWQAAQVAKPHAAIRCTRCGGAGFLSQYRHRQGGVCFACGGSGNR